MWLLDSIADGFSHPVADARLQVYRILIGVAVLLKVGATAFLGDWDRLAPGAVGRFAAQRRFGDRHLWFTAAHKPLIVARAVAGLLLVLGIAPKLAVVVAVVGFAHELAYEYRFNTVYLSLCLLCLLPAGDLGTGFSFSAGSSSANTWAQFLIVLITIDVYWNSAYQKLRSGQFVSGLSLAQLAYVAEQVRPRMPAWEYTHPRLGVTRAAAAGEPGPLWPALAVGTIVAEVLLPVGLLVPAFRPYAIAAGFGLHLGFLGILPLRLAAFTLVTLASYILFVP